MSSCLESVEKSDVYLGIILPHNGPGEPASEAEFGQHTMAEPDSSHLELEKFYKRTKLMIRETVRLLALVSPLPEEGKAVKQDPTELRSFHGTLFQVLCQIRANLRRMFEPQDVVEIVAVDNQARCSVAAWGAFTLGAACGGGRTRFELDLTDPNADLRAPKEWRKHRGDDA